MSEIELVGYVPGHLCTVSFICSNCKQHVNPDDVKCKHCGDDLEPSELLKMIDGINDETTALVAWNH